jgi:predicted DNA-binding transcriptional regulator YafY
MSRPTSRVLTLLELLQSGGTRTVAELAERLGVDGRTVRRYVDHLVDLDVPVESVRGRYGGYRLARGYRLPPLMLTDDEALAVLLGLATDRGARWTTELTARETAAAKIRRVLPKHLSSRLHALTEAVVFTDQAGGLETPDADVLLTVADGVSHRRPLAIRYTDGAGRRSDRTVHAFGIVAHAGRWYITGHDPAIGEDRTFRLDRVAAARPLPGSFDASVDLDPAQLLLSRLATAERRHEVSMRIQATVAQIRAHLPASGAIVQDDEPVDGEAGWRRVELQVEHLGWLPPVLAALDRPFVVERPDELRDLVVALAERLVTWSHR